MSRARSGLIRIKAPPGGRRTLDSSAGHAERNRERSFRSPCGRYAEPAAGFPSNAQPDSSPSPTDKDSP